MDAQASLTSLGFTALEAEVYTALLASPSTTGYRIAQVIGKPVANVYKAIESLQTKGAVLVDNSGSKLCRAVSPHELLTSMERRFSKQIELAGESLAKIGPAKADERTYELLTRNQVLDRARLMLASCKEVVLLDLFPIPLDILRDDIVAATKRGVTAAVLVYHPVTLPGIFTIVHDNGDAVRKRWPGEWLNLVVDAKEHLLSFLSLNGKEVLQAVWSASPYLSWIYHGGLCGEMMSWCFDKAIRKNASRKDLLAIRKQFTKVRALEAPGYQELLRKFGGSVAAISGTARLRRTI